MNSNKNKLPLSPNLNTLSFIKYHHYLYQPNDLDDFLLSLLIENYLIDEAISLINQLDYPFNKCISLCICINSKKKLKFNLNKINLEKQFKFILEFMHLGQPFRVALFLIKKFKDVQIDLLNKGLDGIDIKPSDFVYIAQISEFLDKRILFKIIKLNSGSLSNLKWEILIKHGLGNVTAFNNDFHIKICIFKQAIINFNILEVIPKNREQFLYLINYYTNPQLRTDLTTNPSNYYDSLKIIIMNYYNYLKSYLNNYSILYNSEEFNYLEFYEIKFKFIHELTALTPYIKIIQEKEILDDNDFIMYYYLNIKLINIYNIQLSSNLLFPEKLKVLGKNYFYINLNNYINKLGTIIFLYYNLINKEILIDYLEKNIYEILFYVEEELFCTVEEYFRGLFLPLYINNLEYINIKFNNNCSIKLSKLVDLFVSVYPKMPDKLKNRLSYFGYLFKQPFKQFSNLYIYFDLEYFNFLIDLILIKPKSSVFKIQEFLFNASLLPKEEELMLKEILENEKLILKEMLGGEVLVPKEEELIRFVEELKINKEELKINKEELILEDDELILEDDELFKCNNFYSEIFKLIKRINLQSNDDLFLLNKLNLFFRNKKIYAVCRYIELYIGNKKNNLPVEQPINTIKNTIITNNSIISDINDILYNTNIDYNSIRYTSIGDINIYNDIYSKYLILESQHQEDLLLTVCNVNEVQFWYIMTHCCYKINNLEFTRFIERLISEKLEELEEQFVYFYRHYLLYNSNREDINILYFKKIFYTNYFFLNELPLFRFVFPNLFVKLIANTSLLPKLLSLNCVNLYSNKSFIYLLEEDCKCRVEEGININSSINIINRNNSNNNRNNINDRNNNSNKSNKSNNSNNSNNSNRNINSNNINNNSNNYNSNNGNELRVEYNYSICNMNYYLKIEYKDIKEIPSLNLNINQFYCEVFNINTLIKEVFSTFKLKKTDKLIDSDFNYIRKISTNFKDKIICLSSNTPSILVKQWKTLIDNFITKKKKCIICYEIELNQRVTQIQCLRCSSAYHTSCWEDWVRSSRIRECVLCKYIID